jgi:spermidine synthase
MPHKSGRDSNGQPVPGIPDRVANSAGWIFWVSLVGLYLELLLIRWVGTEIRVFAYLQNTVLITCFLGLGVGLFTARRAVRLGRAVVALLVLACMLSLPAIGPLVRSISELLSVLGDVNIWNAASTEGVAETIVSVALGLALALVVLILICEAFVPLGRLLGRLLDEHPRPILAYSVNVGGSLVGTWLFVLLSQFRLPPVAWFAVLLAVCLPLLRLVRPSPRLALVGLAATVLVIGLFGPAADTLRTIWSPYQKLELLRPGSGTDSDRQVIRVNNVGYQEIVNLDPDWLRGSLERYRAERLGYSQYDIPFLLRPGASRVLIVGAGSGNDAAGALRHGVSRITAVEIDPAIIQIGRASHPEAPYASPRVEVIADDARSFFARTGDTYDLIVFGLLDSHTTTSMTNARLDHYVYTLESLGRTRNLLSEDGVLVLTFKAARRFIADRLGAALLEVFGEEPIVVDVPEDELGWGGVMFVAGDIDGVRSRLRDDARLSEVIGADGKGSLGLDFTTVPTTDDWPYLYLQRPGIPLLFVLLGTLMVAVLLYLRTEIGLPAGMNPLDWDRSNWHFFALGAGFLLLEVQNISKASVVLGSTWLVNAVIISAVLCMVLLANLIVSKWQRVPLGWVYVGLLGSPLLLYAFDLARLAFLPYPIKPVAVGAFTTLPMLFSGVVFVRSFAGAARKDVALGANLLGALVGALLQSLSFLTGIRSLLLLVVAFYAAALLTRPRAGVAGSGQVAPGPVSP